MWASGGLGSQISRQSENEGHKFVSPTHWPPLPPGNILGTSFHVGQINIDRVLFYVHVTVHRNKFICNKAN